MERCTRMILLFTLLAGLAGAARAANEGQDDLDKATEVKLNASTLSDLDEVIRLAESALKKGLDEGNTQFANGLLASTLAQRGGIRSALVLRVSPADPRFPELRKATLDDLERAVKLDAKHAQALLLISQLHRLPGGDLKRADQALEAALKASENDPEAKAKALLFRAAVTDDLAKKQTDLDEAVKLAPGDAAVVRTRGLVYADLGKFEQALADLNKAIELEPQQAMAFEAKALVLVRLKKFDEALAALDQMRQLLPDSAAPLMQKARVRAMQSNVRGALGELAQARAIEPNNVAVLLLQATIEETSEAKLAALNEAVRIAPANPLVLRARAVLLAEQGKVEAAMADFDKAIAMQPKDPSGYEAKALVLAKLKKYDEALATVDALIKAEPALKAASRFRAMLLAEAGRKDEAIAEIEKLYQGDTKDLATAMSLAMLYTSAKKSAKAVEIYTAVLAQDAGNPAALRGRADALLNVGRQSEALADYEKALKLAPKDSGLLNNLAWLLATSPDDKLRDGKRAVTLATEACELTDYKAPHILSTLGAAYAEAGDFANAIKWVEKGLESANDDEKKSLTKELESYRAGKPFREVLADKEEAPQESKKEEPKKDEPKPEEPKKP